MIPSFAKLTSKFLIPPQVLRPVVFVRAIHSSRTLFPIPPQQVDAKVTPSPVPTPSPSPVPTPSPSSVPTPSPSPVPTPKQNLLHPSPLHKLPKDHIYIVDANLVIAFIKKKEPWSSWVGEYLKTRNFFVLPTAVTEIKKKDPLPEGFVELSLPPNEQPPKSSIASAYEELAADLCLTDEGKVTHENDMVMVLTAGYCAASCLDISLDDLLQCKVHFITANMKLVKRILKTPQKRALVETAIDRNGLEHLISVIGVFESEWEEFK